MRISDWSSDVCSSDLADAGEIVGVFRGFHAFRHRRHAERACKRQQVVNEDLVLGVRGDIADEGAVDLHHVDGECLQVMEGGEAGRSEEHTSELQSLMRISYAVI